MKIDYSLKTTIRLYMLLGVLIFTVAVPATSAKGIFKCVKPNGDVEYTESAAENCDAQAIKKGGGTEDQEAIDDLLEEKKQAKIAADEERDKQMREKDKQRTAEEIEEYCESLRVNLEQIIIANRVFETDEQGNRIRLNEEQRLQRIQDNQDNLAQHCS